MQKQPKKVPVYKILFNSEGGKNPTRMVLYRENNQPYGHDGYVIDAWDIGRQSVTSCLNLMLENFEYFRNLPPNVRGQYVHGILRKYGRAGKHIHIVTLPRTLGEIQL